MIKVKLNIPNKKEVENILYEKLADIAIKKCTKAELDMLIKYSELKKN